MDKSINVFNRLMIEIFFQYDLPQLRLISAFARIKA